MPLLRFTANLRRHFDCPPLQVDGATVRESLEVFFLRNPAARSYLLDDQGAVRKHVAVFVNGESVVDRLALSDAVRPDDEIDVLQALSGG